MNLQEYLHTTFPGLILKPSLYLQMFDTVYSQALAIFNDLFSEEDEIFLVTNVYHRKNSNSRTKPIKVYKNSVKNKNLAFHLKQETLPYVFDDEEANDYYTAQYCLKCRKQDLRYPLLIKAACNEDFSLKPMFRREKGMFYPDVFFINVSKNLIFFIYDDRGCEVISDNKETLRPSYEKYHDWLYEYNREEMKRLFA